MSKNFTYKNLIDLLIKKASGFYYSEEQYEYEKTQKYDDFNKNHTAKIKNQNILFENETQISFLNDTSKLLNEKQKPHDKNNENLTLVKKKVTTHFISPDMLAIKILLEIYGKEINKDNFETISDEELLKLKNKLAGELLNESINNKE